MGPGWRQRPRTFAPQASVMAAGVRDDGGHEYTCFMRGGEDARLHERFLRNKNAALPARAQKNPLDPQRPEKIWVPAGASGHELSRPKRVSWLPAYGMMAAMSIPVSCVGVKTHVFMNDLVVTHWTADIESTAPLDFL